MARFLRTRKNEIISFYKQLYSKNQQPTAWFSSWSSKKLSAEKCLWLERTFSEEEIKSAVFSMADDKAPGPDGFTVGFFQQCGDIVKQDFVNLLDEFHSNGIVSRGLNSTFITLIPK